MMSKDMKLVLVRHGETPWNLEKRVQGFSDIALSDLGRLQAQRLAQCLRGESIGKIVSSPLSRARETAQAIACFHDLPVAIEPDLRELNQGDFEGRTYKELEEKHPLFFRQWHAHPASVTVPGGESLAELQGRAWPVVERIIEEGQDALIVSHSFTIITLLCRIQGLSLDHFREARVDLASRTVVSISDGQSVVVLHNDTSHLCEMRKAGLPG
jgi:phosphoserine phosphatase